MLTPSTWYKSDQLIVLFRMPTSCNIARRCMATIIHLQAEQDVV